MSRPRIYPRGTCPMRQSGDISGPVPAASGQWLIVALAKRRRMYLLPVGLLRCNAETITCARIQSAPNAAARRFTSLAANNGAESTLRSAGLCTPRNGLLERLFAKHDVDEGGYLKHCSADEIYAILAKIMRTTCPEGREAEWCAEHCLKPRERKGTTGCVTDGTA